MNTEPTYTTHEITRDNDRNLRFEGRSLGHGEQGNSMYRADWNRWTVVEIYETESGRYVVAITSYTKWEGERDRSRALIIDTAEELIPALVEDAGGHLGSASKEALENAAKKCEAIAAHICEEI